MKQQILITLAVAALAAGCSSDRHSNMGATDASSQRVTGTAAATTSALAADDSNFAREACQSGRAEVELGKLADRNTKNEAVRTFATKLVSDHTQMESELKKIGASKGINKDADKNVLDPQYQSSIERLSGLKDNEFDQAFKQQAIQDHEKAIKLFEKQANQGTDAELKAFAQKHLAHLREHLSMAQKLEVGGQTETKTTTTTDEPIQTPSTEKNPPNQETAPPK